MTVEEIVHLLKGRPAGPNRWFARCPVHEEKSASLSIRAGKKAVLLHCFGCHAKAAQVMGVHGYKASDCFYDAHMTMTPERRKAYRKRKQDEERLADLQLRWSLALWATYAYPAQRAVWAAMERLSWRALKHQDLEMDPERKTRYLLARDIKRRGFDALWAELEQSEAWPGMMAEVSR